MHIKHRILVTLVMAVMLSACGFQLRGSGTHQANLPFKTVYLGFPANSPLGTELRRYVRASGETTVVTEAKAAQATIELLSETREKGNIFLNTQGLVREYSLIYKIRFRVKDNADRELLAPTEIVLKRDVSYNESQALAKEKEEELLYRDMQSDSVQQILRRVAVLKAI